MKRFTQKIMLLLVALLALNFIIPNSYSHADIGGVLMDPITDLLCTIGDAVINLLQTCMSGWNDTDFSLTDGGFLASAEDFKFDTITIEGESGASCTINPEEEFNKTLITGKVQDYYFPVTTYSPEQIFANKVAGLDINFINPNKYTHKQTDGSTVTVESAAAKLQKTISGWYVALRNLTVVGLLSVLVYVGIRIIISSTAGDKAKYKQMFMDWLVALCLVFFLHYIMSFTLTMVDAVTDSIGGNGSSSYTINVTGKGTFKTNLLGAARFKTQYDDFGKKMAYLIMYLALVIYTCIFTFFYLKRLLMMAFLTIIAPVVALTYPIDKMNDGKAQAFNSWLKEYVFNALIQPFHLIIYIVFVGSAMDFAADNVIYMIAALGFILPAEKILRNFFGFNKAGATLGSITGAAALGSIGGKLLGGSKGGSKGGGGSSSSGESKDSKGIRFEKGHDIGQIEGENPNGTSTNRITNDNKERLPSGGPSAADTNMGNEGEDPTKRARREALEEQIADGQIDKSELSAKDMELLGMNADNQENDKLKTDEQRKLDEQTKENEEKAKEEAEKAKINPLRNFANAHNINGRSIAGFAGRKIAGAAKLGTRVAFKAGAGSLAAAVALASGGGMAGAVAAGATGIKLGGKAADKTIGVAGKVSGGVQRVGRGVGAAISSDRGEKWDKAKEATLGGTAIGKELDTAYGGSKYKRAGQLYEYKHNAQNLEYLKDQMTAQNDGNIPSMKEVRSKMEDLDPYIGEGFDIKESLKADKVASNYGIDPKEMALIAAVGKEKGINKDILNDEKKAAQQHKNMEHEFKNKGLSAAEAERRADYTMNVLKEYNGVANNLQKVEKQPVQSQVKPQNVKVSKDEKRALRSAKAESRQVRNVVKPSSSSRTSTSTTQSASSSRRETRSMRALTSATARVRESGGTPRPITGNPTSRSTSSPRRTLGGPRKK